MKDIALILFSHGHMAEETLRSAEMIAGAFEDARALSIYSKDTVESIKKNLKEVLKELKGYKNFLVMVDIIGGTPCNVAITELYKEKNVRIISGFNLAMVLEFGTSRESNIDKLKDYLISLGKSQIKDLKQELKGE
jgi:PTS system mannose-specific IIA component